MRQSVLYSKWRGERELKAAKKKNLETRQLAADIEKEAVEAQALLEVNHFAETLLRTLMK